MKMTVKLLSTALLTLSFGSFATNITLNTADGFALKADFYQSAQKTDRAVLMLHQCNYNRTMYNQIGEQLAQQGIHALSLDFRGYGESVNEQFDVEKVFALPDDERRKAWREMAADWPKDVQLAYGYLADKIGEKGDIGVIGASCGGAQAIKLAEKHPIKAISFFSSGQREENIAIYRHVLASKPTLIIAAEGDSGTYSSAQQIFTSAQHLSSRFIAYKGGEHGYPLLDKDAMLASQIVAWFTHQL